MGRGRLLRHGHDGGRPPEFCQVLSGRGGKYDLDGIDIDWEYPCNDAAGIGADPRDKENFTALLATLREYLGKDRIVSIAVGASQRCIADTQMDKVAEIVDYVQLMTYDMVDGTRAGHHAALGATRATSPA